MTSDVSVTDEIMTNYVTFLLSGHTINDVEIKADTIKKYMKVVNDYYVRHSYMPPFNSRSKSEAASLLREQEKYEKDLDRHKPLPGAVLKK